MCCIDICVSIVEDEDGGNEEIVNAQVSTTCVPCVLVTFIVEPLGRGVVMPWRAGMVVSDIFSILFSFKSQN